MGNKSARVRRARKTRVTIKEAGVCRLCVHRTPRHIYAQVIDPVRGQVIASASTLQKDVREHVAGYTGNVRAAQVVGRLVAERAQAAGVEAVAFDRSGFKYHGRIKALADAAREQGLHF